MDARIDAWEQSALADQTDGRQNGTWGLNYGQVLILNGRPSDQPNDGPQFPTNLEVYSVMNVYEAPNGFGWFSQHEADEAGQLYLKTVLSHEDGPLQKSDWVEYDPEPLP
jgi:hypothetical protein